MLDIAFVSSIPDDFQLLVGCTHRGDLAFLSYIVACAAAYTALGMAERVSQTHSVWRSELWRWVGGLSLGGGIWAMHFIAMLAFITPIEINYDWSVTGHSLLVAVLVSYIVMWVIGRPSLTVPQYLFAAVAAGLGVATMHYMGMSAIRSEAQLFYDPLLFSLSIFIAISASLVALILAFYFRNKTDNKSRWLSVLSALLMGLAIYSMHFIGMASLNLAIPPGTVLSGPMHDQDALILGSVITGITLLIISMGLASAWIDRTLHRKIRDLKELSQQLNSAESNDSLTSLINVRAFVALAGKQLQTSNSKHVLLVVNIDQFKRINNSLGYLGGNEVLKQLAQRLRTVIDSHDLLGRISADEFIALCRVRDNSSAKMRDEMNGLVKRIREQLAPPFSLSNQKISISVSTGMAIQGDDGDNFESLFRCADIALRHGKHQGRNQNHWYNAEMQAQVSDDLLLEQDLRHALNSGGLSVYFQPILAQNGQQVVCLEALARWHHPRHGFISPERFIALAEELGFIGELDDWILETACRHVRALQQEGFTGLRVSVNCSALNLANPKLPEHVARALRRSGLDAKSLSLEVTETALMGNLNSAIRILEDIKQLGVQLSIDDFGSGYSSLAYLQKLPVNVLKIDRSFIKDTPDNQADCAITAAIIAMAHKLDLKVVAEGVETAAQWEFLRHNHCEYLQGYHFSKPLPLAEVKQFLQAAKQSASVSKLSTAQLM